MKICLTDWNMNETERLRAEVKALLELLLESREVVQRFAYADVRDELLPRIDAALRGGEEKP